MKFIKLTVKNHQIMHGYDKKNKEILEQVVAEKATTKLIAIDRIKSISEKYILMTYAQDRMIYWEYEDKYSDLVAKLAAAGMLI